MSLWGDDINCKYLKTTGATDVLSVTPMRACDSVTHRIPKLAWEGERSF